MKNNNSFSIIENITNALNNITLKTDDRGNYVLGFSGATSPKRVIDNKISVEDESSSKKCSENAQSDNIKINNSDINAEYDQDIRQDYNDNTSNNYNTETSLNSQGVIDSIANELTSVRLQQAIILSEIVGKPRSKTRRKRRF